MSLENTKILMVGCGKMGYAMLEGWLNGSVKAENVEVIDPFADKSLFDKIGVSLHKDISEYSEAPDIVFFAIKPQNFNEVVAQYAKFQSSGKNTLYISVAAGKSTDTIEKSLAFKAPIVRTMPNLPATIAKGITGIYANNNCTESQVKLAQDLLSYNGQVITVSNEDDIDIITGVSGSGPAYIFYLIEAISQVAEEKGLSKENSYNLALGTVYGAASLAESSELDATQLRKNVTSPNGTTQAGLDELMKEDSGLKPVIERTISAAINRAKELNE
jgi:pyrroline-5-carboxylate reductase